MSIHTLENISFAQCETIRREVEDLGGCCFEDSQWNSERGEYANILRVFLPTPQDAGEAAEADSAGNELTMQNRIYLPTVDEQLAERVQTVKNRWPSLRISDDGALWMVAGDKKNSEAIRNAAAAKALV